MKYHPSKSNIHVVARGFVTNDEDMILCRVRGANWLFFPGGHIENGESAAATLLREFKEEIGENNYTVNNFMGICESVFQLNEEYLQHSVDIVFHVSLDKDFKIDTTRKEHIEFVEIKTEELEKYNVLPAVLKAGVIEWARDRKTFYKKTNNLI